MIDDLAQKNQLAQISADLAQKSVVSAKKKNTSPIPGKVYHFMLSSVSGCHIMIDFLLLGYYYQS